jgi:hypothetical protein
VILTAHAIERYRDRVKPHLTFGEASAELRRLLRHATVVSERPSWSNDRYEDATYVVLSDGIALVVRSDQYAAGVAVTCLTRAGVSDETRTKRNRRRPRRTVFGGRSRNDRRARPAKFDLEREL